MASLEWRKLPSLRIFADWKFDATRPIRENGWLRNEGIQMKSFTPFRSSVLICGLAIALGSLAACGGDDEGGRVPPPIPTATPVPPDLITFELFDLRPEGIEYDSVSGRFVVGSTTQGTIHSVDDDGELEALFGDPGLVGTVGLHIDRANDILYAAGRVADPNWIGLGVYDLAAGEVVRVVDLAPVAPIEAGHLANDVAVDGSGNAYVTDTFAGAVYKIDSAGVPSVLLETPELALANGIEIFNDEVLLVARIGGAGLVRIPLDDPDSFALVESDFGVSGDGIVFTPRGDLVVVTIGGVASVLLLSSDDDWQSATLSGTWDSSQISGTSPTTAAIRGDDVYVVFARVLEDDVLRYDIERVDFAPVDGGMQ